MPGSHGRSQSHIPDSAAVDPYAPVHRGAHTRGPSQGGFGGASLGDVLGGAGGGGSDTGGGNGAPTGKFIWSYDASGKRVKKPVGGGGGGGASSSTRGGAPPHRGTSAQPREQAVGAEGTEAWGREEHLTGRGRAGGWGNDDQAVGGGGGGGMGGVSEFAEASAPPSAGSRGGHRQPASSGAASSAQRRPQWHDSNSAGDDTRRATQGVQGGVQQVSLPAGGDRSGFERPQYRGMIKFVGGHVGPSRGGLGGQDDDVPDFLTSPQPHGDGGAGGVRGGFAPPQHQVAPPQRKPVGSRGGIRQKQPAARGGGSRQPQWNSDAEHDSQDAHESRQWGAEDAHRESQHQQAAPLEYRQPQAAPMGPVDLDDLPVGGGGGGMRAPPGVSEYPPGGLPPEALEAPPPGSDQRQECHTCGRKFNPAALAKHAKVCTKVFATKRKAFNAAANRIPEEAQQKAASAGGGAPRGRGGRTRPGARPPKPAAAATGGGGKGGKGEAWKNKSEQLRAAMKASRIMAKAKAEGKDLSTIELPTVPDLGAADMVPCPHCGRTFNESAAERHIPRCKTTRAKPSRLVRGGGVNMSNGSGVRAKRR